MYMYIVEARNGKVFLILFIDKHWEPAFSIIGFMDLLPRDHTFVHVDVCTGRLNNRNGKSKLKYVHAVL